jgi:tetraacyldisaccharide 4'-kinase
MPGWSDRIQRAWARRGPVSALLLPLSWLFGLATALRRLLYRLRWLRAERLPVRVVVVGNLIAGGAGKTPTVLALVGLLSRHGYRPAIVSRGYGGNTSGPLAVDAHTPAHTCGDEPLLMRRRAGVPVYVGQDRTAAIRNLLNDHPQTDVVVSDDGLQHLRMARDLQVLVFDERGVGNGRLLPAGPLREPLPRLVPPASVVLYNAPSPTTRLPGWTAQRRLAGIVALDSWWTDQRPRVESLELLKGVTVIAAAGMARPERFFGMLNAAGIDVVPLPLADHYDYVTLPWPSSARTVIVTEKDAVKLDPARLASTRVWVAALDFVPAPEFDAAVLRLLGPPAASLPPNHHGNAPAEPAGMPDLQGAAAARPAADA